MEGMVKREIEVQLRTAESAPILPREDDRFGSCLNKSTPALVSLFDKCALVIPASTYKTRALCKILFRCRKMHCLHFPNFAMKCRVYMLLQQHLSFHECDVVKISLIKRSNSNIDEYLRNCGLLMYKLDGSSSTYKLFLKKLNKRKIRNFDGTYNYLYYQKIFSPKNLRKQRPII